MAFVTGEEQVPQYLFDLKVPFTPKNNGNQLIVEGKEGFIDYWPTTGKWIDRKSKEQGFGFRQLMMFIGITLDGWE